MMGTMAGKVAYSLISLLSVRTVATKLVSAPETAKNDIKFDLGRDLLRGNEAQCPVPPFSAPFPLSDSEAFDIVSTCPFLLHQKVTGEEIYGCYPMYSISQQDNSNSISFEIIELDVGAKTPMFFEGKSHFLSWEELDFVSNIDTPGLGECMERLDFKVEGFDGEISGDEGTANLSAIVITYKEYGKENTILLPVGGCEVHSHQSFSHRKLMENKSGHLEKTMMTTQGVLEQSCSVRPNDIEWNECLEICFKSVESIYADERDKLLTKRDERISKNVENRETVLGKLLITRTTQLSMAFARCKCKHNDQDLGQCFLHIFLDTLVAENELQFEVEDSLDRHMDEVGTWFQNSLNLLCDDSIKNAAQCRKQC